MILFVRDFCGYLPRLSAKFPNNTKRRPKLSRITAIKLFRMSNLTFGIIKPDAVRAGNQGKIVDRILSAGFKVRGMKLIHQSLKQAEGFYAVHAERPFFGELTQFMSSGPCVVLALEKDNAVPAWRDLMGATNPAEAADGTLRKEFASSIGENAVHGSDSEENAAIEIAYFFSKLELV